jgi:hypothetical protein
MTFKEQEQITKKILDDQQIDLGYLHGQDLISEIVRIGIKNHMEFE